MSELNQIHTACRSCCFAMWNPESTEKPEQIGCELNMLNKFARADEVSVVPAYDENCEFYIVNGRTCPTFRDVAGPWYEKNKENKFEQIAREFCLHATTLLIVENKNSLDEVVNCVRKLAELPYLPKEVVIVLSGATFTIGELHAAVMTLTPLPFDWCLTHVVDPISLTHAIDCGVNRMSKGNFYWVVLPHLPIKENQLELANHMLTNKLERFCVLHDNELHGILVMRRFHEDGDVGGSGVAVMRKDDTVTVLPDILAKARWLAETYETPWLIRSYEEAA